jgi:hypothetical protein
MSLPNSFPHGYQVSYNIVSGGHALDAPTDQSGTCRVIDPLRHGADVDPFQMPYVTMLRSPTQSALEETPFPPEPGSCVGVSFNMGDPSSRVLIGQPNELNNSQSSPGNFSIMELIQKLAALSTNKNRPTKYQEKEDKGAIVRAIDQELGDWMNSLTKGLPTHAALYPLAGQILPSIQQIDTAVQQFASIINSFGGMAGSPMNMSSMLNKLDNNKKKQITQNMPPEIADAFNSYLNLMTDGSHGESNFVYRVDEETFLKNAVEILSQCNSIGDLTYCLQELRSNTELHGANTLGSMIVTANSAYGPVQFTMDNKGNKKQDPVNAQQIMSIIQQFMGLLNSAQGGGQGKTMFGDAAGKVVEAVGRLPPEAKMRLSNMSDTMSTYEKIRDPIHKAGLDGDPMKIVNLFHTGELGA